MPDALTAQAGRWTLHGDHHPAATGPRAVILLLHAMMADRRSCDRPAGAGVASELARAGFDVINADFRGRGAAGPRPSEGARWGYDALVREDVPAWVGVAREVAARRGGAPVVVMGHSLGGHVSLASLAGGHTSVDAWVGLAANIWLRSLEPSRRYRLIKLGSIGLFAAVAAAHGHLPARRLRLGSADEAMPYAADLFRFVATDRWRSADGHEDWMQLAQRLTLPRLSLLATGDHLLGREAGARPWAQAAGATPAEVWRVGGGERGVAAHPGHMELVTDPAHRGWIPEVARWLDDTLSAPRGA